MSVDHRVCAVCDQPLHDRRRDARYCSSGCRSTASKLRRSAGRDAAVPGLASGEPPEALGSAEEAYRAVREATRRIAARYELVPPALRPNPNGAAWIEHDRRIERAFARGDYRGVQQAVVEWEKFAFGHLPAQAKGGDGG